MPNKKDKKGINQKIKEKLEKERDILIEEIETIGKLNKETGTWETVPENLDYKEFDQNDIADRFEDFESRSSTMEVLRKRLKDVSEALKNISKASFGICSKCKKKIENARILANPAATTCKKHIN